MTVSFLLTLIRFGRWRNERDSTMYDESWIVDLLQTVALEAERQGFYEVSKKVAEAAAVATIEIPGTEQSLALQMLCEVDTDNVQSEGRRSASGRHLGWWVN